MLRLLLSIFRRVVVKKRNQIRRKKPSAPKK